jgi:hypothetical protein
MHKTLRKMKEMFIGFALIRSVTIRWSINVFVSGTMFYFLCHMNMAIAGDFKCTDSRIEKGSSTWGYARNTGQDYRIEKGSSTIGWVKKSGEYWRVETAGGATLAWLKNAHIETPGGSTWVTLTAIKEYAECPVPVMAGLWVLMQGKQKHD